jgi:hypothetical protein
VQRAGRARHRGRRQHGRRASVVHVGALTPSRSEVLQHWSDRKRLQRPCWRWVP